jgi:hypothetical protein
MNYNWVTKVEVRHPSETCYDWTVDELQLSYEGGSAPSIRKPVMSYDSTVDELQLSYEGGSATSIRKPVLSYDSTVDELQLRYQGSTSHLGNLSPKPSYFALSPHTTQVTSNSLCKWVNIICK